MVHEIKLKQRFLSFFLAFAMVFGMIPSTVWATDSITITGTDPAQGEDTATFTAAIDNQPTDATWKWTVSSNADKVDLTDDDKAKVTVTVKDTSFKDGADPFTVKLTVTMTYTDDSTGVETVTATKEVTFTPDAIKPPEITALNADATTIKVGETVTVTATVLNLDDDIKWSVTGGGSVSSESGDNKRVAVIKGDSAGDITVTATIEGTSDYTAVTKTCTIKVEEVVVDPPKAPTIEGITTVEVGASITLTAKGTYGEDAIYTWYLGGTQQSQGLSDTYTFSNLKAQTYEVTCTVTENGQVSEHSSKFSFIPTYAIKITASSNDVLLIDGDKKDQVTITAVTDSATSYVEWSYDQTNVIRLVEGKDKTAVFEAVSAGTASITATHPTSNTQMKLTLTVEVVPTFELDPDSPVKDGGTLKFSSATPKELDFIATQGINVETSIRNVVTVSEKIVGNVSIFTIQPVANGSTTITFSLDGKSRSSDIVVYVEVTGIASEDTEEEEEEEEEEQEDSNTPSIEKQYTPKLVPTYLDNVTLTTAGTYADRKITVTAEQVDNGAEPATNAELTAKAEEFQDLLTWSIPGAAQSMTEIVEIPNGRRFVYVQPGQTTVTYWIDLDNDGVLDADEEKYSNKFTLTNQGITLSESSIKMSTYESSSTVYVYTYGDVGTVTSSSQNTSIVTVSQSTVTGESEASYSLIMTSTSEVGNTNVIVTYSGGNESIEVVVSDSVAGSIEVGHNTTINTSNPLYFKDLIDLIDDEAEKVYAGEHLIRIQSLEVPASEGILYVGYQDPEHTGGAVGTSISYYVDGTPSLKEVVFVPSPYFTGSQITIKYTGYTSSGRSFYGEILVHLSEVLDVLVQTSAQQPVTLDGEKFATISQVTMAQNLASVVFTLPEENQAILYYDYVDSNNYHHAVAPGEVISLKNLDKVTIVPSPGFGTPAQDGEYTNLDITYTATGVNGTVKTQIMVLRVTPYSAAEAVIYNTRAGEYLTLVTDDFHVNSRANSGNYNTAGDYVGEDMAYMTFSLPESWQGTLYEDYNSEYDYRAVVTDGTKYYASYRDPQIAEVSFVPAQGFTGVVNIPFIGTDVTGSSYEGTLQVNVTTHTEQDINYICTSGSYVSFYAEDFNQISRTLVGNNIDSIVFTGQPDSYQGELRLNQTPDGDYGVDVLLGASFYRTGSPYISAVSFSSVPGFTGTVEIPFDGRSTTGQLFSAVISVTVTNQNVAQIPYSATRYSPATLTADDFEKYSILRTDSELDYVRFNLPDPAQGTLYYDYSNPDDYDSLVSIDDDFFADSKSSTYLGNVTFVPAPDFVGTAHVTFTAWGENGQSYVGSLNILVVESGDPLHYQIHAGDFIYLNATELNNYCRNEIGNNLEYITISLPTSRQGALYEEFSPYTSSSTWVSASENSRYYRSKDTYIKDLVFVAADYFIGTVELPFTAVTSDGSSCTGLLTIVVLPKVAESVVEYATSFTPIVFSTADIAAQANGATIDYITLHNLPTASAGKLYYENNLNSFATIDTPYFGYNPDRGASIDSLIFVPQATYSGVVTLAYTAYTLTGGEFVGEIQIVMTPQLNSQYFSDLWTYSWATSSADYLRTTGVTSGIGNNQFGPALNITRGDYALMLQRAFRFGDVNGGLFADVPTDKYYANAVHTLRYYGIVEGDENMFYPEDYISRQDAMVMMCRAMAAAPRNLPTADISVLYDYRDVTSVYVYAAEELSVMVKAGIVSGDDNQRLNPQDLMTRAEMAVVIHKAMTY